MNSRDYEKVNYESDSLFRRVPTKNTGIAFSNTLNETINTNSITFEYFHNGGGVAVGDINQDGLPDLYFIANVGSNKLYLNKGDLTFADITDRAGVAASAGWKTGVAISDVNGDGWLDIYVCRSGKVGENMRRNLLYINNGDLTFIEKAGEYGLDDPAYSTQATFFDYDLDGDLDMYLLNHNVELYSHDDIDELMATKLTQGSDKMYRNENGKFKNVSEKAGLIENALGYGLGVSIGDFNNDGWPDIYVANDYSERDYLYLNEKRGNFTEVLMSSVGHISSASMGTDIADIDNDGWMDLVVLDMAMNDHYSRMTNMAATDFQQQFQSQLSKGLYYQYTMNTLQWNRGVTMEGVPEFSEVANFAGISATDWSWAPLFADFDNDGFQDLFVTNGIKSNFINYPYLYYKLKKLKGTQNHNKIPKFVTSDLMGKIPSRKVSNRMFRNNGDLTFSDVTELWSMNVPSFSNGAVYSDLDRDGDLDLVVNNINEKALIYRNESDRRANKHFLQIKLRGPRENIFGIGARVILYNRSQFQVRENYQTRGYLSSVEPIVHFGTDTSSVIDSVEVIWPGNKKTILKNIHADQLVTISYDNFRETRKERLLRPSDGKLFRQVGNIISPSFIPKGFSNPNVSSPNPQPFKKETGPPLAVGDVNGDGLEDFFIGGGQGQSGRLYIQKREGLSFVLDEGQGWEVDQDMVDTEAAFFDHDSDGDLDLYVASGGYGYIEEDSQILDRLYENLGNGQFRRTLQLIPEHYVNTEYLAPGDFDNDGDTDLFVGGREPGSFPFTSRSFLLLNNEGIFEDISEKVSSLLPQTGIINKAIWSDIDQDRDLDLIVIGQWMNIEILRNDGDKFSNKTDSDLSDTKGLWMTATVGDMDKDGDEDLIVGNVGNNLPIKATRERPFKMFVSNIHKADDFKVDLAYFQNDTLYPWFKWERVAQSHSHILSKYRKHNTFGKAQFANIYGKGYLGNTTEFEVQTLESVYLENKGKGDFDIKSLPKKAQIGPIGDALMIDIDGDGSRDLIVMPENIKTDVTIPRLDAGKVELLMFDEKGNFETVNPIIYGISIDSKYTEIKVIKLGTRSTTGLLIAGVNKKIELLPIAVGFGI